MYSTWQSPGGHPSNYEPGATSLNFSDRANHYERTPYSVYLSIMSHIYRLFCKEFDIIITLIRHICNIFMLKKVNRSDLGPIDQSFYIFGPVVRLTNTDKHT